jgi:hypothetical protein
MDRSLTNEEVLSNQISALRKNMARCEANGGEWIHFLPILPVKKDGPQDKLVVRYECVRENTICFKAVGSILHFLDGKSMCATKVREELRKSGRLDEAMIDSLERDCFCDFCVAERENANQSPLGEKKLPAHEAADTEGA